MALDFTPASPTANSYVSVAVAVAYFAARLNTDAWDDLSTPEKEQVLMAATARLEMERWRGQVSSLTQALAWPRMGLYDLNRRFIQSGVIPAEIQKMTCELALHLLNQGATDVMAPDPLLQFESVKVGPLDVSPRAGAPAQWQLPPAALRWGGSFLRSTRTQLRVERG